jgi:xylan 1,4-beta-xylosidase
MDGFLKHVTIGKNYATGKVGAPTDFLSFHAKGQPTVVDGHVRMGISNQLKTADEAFAKIAAVPQLAHKPIVIGENDPEGCAACPGPQNAYRNGTMYSSYTAASYARLWELARRRDVKLEGALTWAFTFVAQPWFAGYRQLATRGVDLPVLNAFRLLSHLGSEQVLATSSAEAALDDIVANGVRGKPDVGVLATRSDTGLLRIMLWHYHDDDVPGPDAEIRMAVRGVAGNRTPSMKVWRVDRQHGDAFSAWQAMGSPPEPTGPQIQQLIRASQIAAESVRGVSRESDGSVSLEISVPLHGVALLDLSP